MRRILKKTWAVIKYNLASLLLFEAGYRVGTFFLVMQLVHVTVNFSLEQQNFSYLTAENFIEFLASPLSLLCLLAVLLVILLLFLIEVSALLSGFQHSYQKRKIYASDMLIEGVRRSFWFLRESRGTWIFCAALSAPFLAVYFIIREVSYIKVLEFAARQIYKAVKPTCLLYILIGVLLAVSLSFVFALPYCILEKEKSKEGIQRGVGLLLKQWKKILKGFLILHALILAVTGLVYLLSTALMTGIVMLTKADTVKVSTVLIYKDYIEMGIGIFAGGIQLIMSLAFVYVIYAGFHVQRTQEVFLYTIVKHYAWFSKVGRRRAAAILTALFVIFEGSYLAVLAVTHDTVLESLTADTGITAHRGGALKAPENTLSALAYTIDCGADYAEIDVQETEDKELILLHDDSLKRTAGVKKNVWEMTYPEIEKLDAGASFHTKFRGEKIPTLDQVLNFCEGRLDLNIEIKYNGKNKGIVHKVVRTIRKHKFESHCVVTSMNYQFLEQIKETAPEIRTGYIMTMTYGSISRVKAADFFSVKYTYIDEDFVQEAHALGKEVHAWTVNYRGDVKRMLDLGVDNIITDDPVMVRKVQNQESGTQTSFLALMKYALGI